jgi:hypothetical protein
MSKEKKPKAYAVKVTVKPKSEGIAKYRSSLFKGIVVANNPTEAKELATKIVLDSFDDYDGSSITKPLITMNNITVKSCELFSDFFISTKKEGNG